MPKQAHHPLDRPVWNALTTRQAALALGDGRAVRFAPDYGLFASAADGSPDSLAALAALVPAEGQVALVAAAAPPAVPGAAVVSRSVIWQMATDALTPTGPPDFEIAPLTEADAPQMLALATLTRPGPFFARTHQLGDFVGVKQDGRLVAMAGERMKPTGFTEVSGVCTHPDHRGRGYAGALMRVVAGRILARGEAAFLHSYAHNTGAIALYRSLGFELRRELSMTVLARE
jgi:predicted GNAT family acetyltransferase